MVHRWLFHFFYVLVNHYTFLLLCFLSVTQTIEPKDSQATNIFRFSMILDNYHAVVCPAYFLCVVGINILLYAIYVLTHNRKDAFVIFCLVLEMVCFQGLVYYGKVRMFT